MEPNLAEMTGEEQFRRPKLLSLKSLKLNGDEGVFYITHLDEPKDEDTGRHRKEKVEGVPEVVFLKIRRRLIEASRTGLVRSTSEHNHPNDTVTLFSENSNERVMGTARELRQKYEALRTEQVVYVRFRGSIMRLSVKGASLGSEKKAKTTTDFYKYLGSFKGDDHVYDTLTRLAPTEEGDSPKYFCIDFQRGPALDDAQKRLVYADIKTAYESCKLFDDYYKAPPPATAAASEIDEEEQASGDEKDEPVGDIPF